ncbi:uncharacterized protein [Medicago truncatula]|uniref:uncharacterized protein n=1 Tax=Medicago truncatula TaxID=3880 RepID=UPI00196804AB|nr:uncharacterized protein LOC11436277 [Medicago truncatula]
MQRLWRSRILFCDGEIQIMKVVVCCRMIICSSVTIPTVMLDGFIEIFTMSSEFSTFAVLVMSMSSFRFHHVLFFEEILLSLQLRLVARAHIIKLWRSGVSGVRTSAPAYNMQYPYQLS